jgi:hypothetical protein
MTPLTYKNVNLLVRSDLDDKVSPNLLAKPSKLSTFYGKIIRFWYNILSK